MVIRLPCGNADATHGSSVDRGDQWLSFKPLVASIGQQLATYGGGSGHTIAETAMVVVDVERTRTHNAQRTLDRSGLSLENCLRDNFIYQFLHWWGVNYLLYIRRSRGRLCLTWVENLSAESFLRKQILLT